MGMAVSIDVRGDGDESSSASRGLTEVLEWLHHVDATFSPYVVDSPISQLGRAEVSLDDVSAEVRDILVLCDEVSEMTHGAFDVFAVPAPNGTTLDPSGMVKGWSIERAAEILEDHGLTDFLINAGGDIAVRGRPSKDDQWSVGIRHPEHAGLFAAVLEVTGPIAVATSATYERGAHIVDPRTGRPTTELASVTLVGPDLTYADAYATAVFVMGIEGLTWLATQPGYDALVITRDGGMLSTPGFEHYRKHGRDTAE
jgi:thiamine biosynthesis lipoprotein